MTVNGEETLKTMGSIIDVEVATRKTHEKRCMGNVKKAW